MPMDYCKGGFALNCKPERRGIFKISGNFSIDNKQAVFFNLLKIRWP